MKKILCALLALFTVSTLIAKEKTTKTSKEIRLKIEGKIRGASGPHARQIADYIEKSRANCAAMGGCGIHNDFCNPACTTTIMNCHRISLDTFLALTAGMSGLAEFPAYKVLNVLADPCPNNWIRCYVHHGLFNTFYRISSQPDTVNDGLDFETYYSKPLLQGIYDRGITSIVLYKGILTSTGDYILPVKVNYIVGEAEYFDISNDLP